MIDPKDAWMESERQLGDALSKLKAERDRSDSLANELYVAKLGLTKRSTELDGFAARHKALSDIVNAAKNEMYLRLKSDTYWAIAHVAGWDVTSIRREYKVHKEKVDNMVSIHPWLEDGE